MSAGSYCNELSTYPAIPLLSSQSRMIKEGMCQYTSPVGFQVSTMIGIFLIITYRAATILLHAV